MSESFRARRDARHLVLEQVGAAGQERIAEGSVLIIGAGGIGCAVAQYLVAADVGHVMLCDFDTVDATNLGRQVLYGDADVGRYKVEVAAERLGAMNPDCDIVTFDERLAGAELAGAVAGADVVLDGCDNFATRFQVNDACVEAGRTLVSGAAIRLEGQLAAFGPDYSTSPCYRCLYTEADESLESCAGNGVLGPVPGIVGAMMATDALKILAGLEVRRGQLRLFDALAGELRGLTIDKRPDCPTCRQ